MTFEKVIRSLGVGNTHKNGAEGIKEGELKDMQPEGDGQEGANLNQVSCPQWEQMWYRATG